MGFRADQFIDSVFSHIKGAQGVHCTNCCLVMMKTRLPHCDFVSDQDRALFTQAVANVQPLKGGDTSKVYNKIHNKVQSKAGRLATTELSQKPIVSSTRTRLPLSDHYPPLSSADALYYHSTGDTRIMAKLKSGKIAKDLVLDLHGYKLREAADQLVRCIHQAQSSKYRVVQVIHGKGSSHGYSVIKSHMPHWLQSLPEVLAYTSCRQEDGGTGAVLVLLRRKHK